VTPAPVPVVEPTCHCRRRARSTSTCQIAFQIRRETRQIRSRRDRWRKNRAGGEVIGGWVPDDARGGLARGLKAVPARVRNAFCRLRPSTGSRHEGAAPLGICETLACRPSRARRGREGRSESGKIAEDHGRPLRPFPPADTAPSGSHAPWWGGLPACRVHAPPPDPGWDGAVRTCASPRGDNDGEPAQPALAPDTGR